MALTKTGLLDRRTEVTSSLTRCAGGGRYNELCRALYPVTRSRYLPSLVRLRMHPKEGNACRGKMRKGAGVTGSTDFVLVGALIPGDRLVLSLLSMLAT